MPADIASLLAGAVFGLALAAPPGPMNAVIAQESVVRGWRPGVRAGLGAMTADLCFLGLALVGVVAILQRRPRLRALMVGIGGLLMLFFAYSAASDARATRRPDGAVGTGRGFRKAFALALTNPYQILFWLTVGVGLVSPGMLDLLAPTPFVGSALAGLVVIETGSPALLIGLFGGIVCWIVAFPAALVLAESRTRTVAPAVAALSAVILAGFGIYFLVDAASVLL